MPVHNPYAKYRESSINTASKEELTLMLYDGALRFCNQAIIAVKDKDIPKSNDFIIKVQNIVRELQVTLDRKYPVSNYFDTMYDYMYRRLVDANLNKDIAVLEEIRDLLRQFRDMWKEAMVLAKQQKK